jgi:enoyl-CoA hydratase/carnithine racemase
MGNIRKLLLCVNEPLFFRKREEIFLSTVLPQVGDYSDVKAFPKEVFPWPEDPPTGMQHSKWHSTTWLHPRTNDGNGSVLYVLENFHWKKHNAFDTKSLKELQAHLRKLDTGDWPAGVVFRPAQKSKVTRDFCPGADYKAIYKDKKYGQDFFKTAYETCYVLATTKKPTFPCIQGRAIGLGAGLALHSIFRIACEDGVWAMPQTLLGAVPDCGATWYLPRLKKGLGMYLALTGRRLVGHDIKMAGIATHFLNKSDMKHFQADTSIYREEPIEDIVAFNLNNLIPAVSSELENRLDDIEHVFTRPSLQEVFQALENLNTDWSKQTLERLKECSPLMLHVTFRLQNLGFYLNSLEEAFALEYRIALNMLDYGEFHKGLKARIIDKKEPEWTYPTINDVPNSEIVKFFQEHPLEKNLDLQPCFPGLIPSKDPFRIYRDQVQQMMNDPTNSWLLNKHLNDVIKPVDQSVQNIKRLMSHMLSSGGMEQVISDFYKKAIMIETLNTDLDDKKFENKRRPSLEEIDQMAQDQIDPEMDGGSSYRIH